MDASAAPLSFKAVVLAAGKGTRMKSDLPKVMHPVQGRPMLAAPIDIALAKLFLQLGNVGVVRP